MVKPIRTGCGLIVGETKHMSQTPDRAKLLIDCGMSNTRQQ
jgi:hypothetical protein